jgi:hypothetical protein
MRRAIAERIYAENIARSVSEPSWRKWFHVKHRGGAGWDGSPFYAKMFHVKHQRAGPENAILQNNPMH